MPEPDHNRIITQAARAGLRPLGLVQKGRSRLWLDDHGWWVGLVEFQPSGFGKGSYLNVAAHWLWHEQDHFSFHYGPSGGDSRLGRFRPFEDLSQFAQAAEQLTQAAADAITRLRDELPSVKMAARRLAKASKHEIWDHYYAAVAAGLAGHSWRARWQFKAVQLFRDNRPWAVDLQQRARSLAPHLANPANSGRKCTASSQPPGRALNSRCGTERMELRPSHCRIKPLGVDACTPLTAPHASSPS